jgi:hypothetical protein
MHFYKGFALHGSDELTGTSSTHGCVNLFKVDAQWLNEEFVETPAKGRKGTLIVIMNGVDQSAGTPPSDSFILSAPG